MKNVSDKRLNEKRFVKDGKLYVFFQKRKGGRVYYTYSEDNTKTWSKPKVVVCWFLRNEKDQKVKAEK